MPPLATRPFAAAVDHTLLDAAATASEIDRLCGGAGSPLFGGVGVYPWGVRRAAERVAGECAVGTVIGSPHGLDTTPAKVAGAREALAAGAGEVDVVIAYGALLSGHDTAV